MKNLFLSLLAAFLAVSSAQAALITSSDSQNVNLAGVNFTFNQFDPTLGSLTGIDLVIQSSTLQGNLTITRQSGTLTINTISAALGMDPVTGFDGYDSTPYNFLRTPSGSFTINSTNTSRLITVNGTTQSLINNTPVTLSINPADFSTYLGISTVSLPANLNLSYPSTSGSGVVNTLAGNLFSPTSMQLIYTYTPAPSPVPEPGQVAASLLVLGGLGVYFVLRRRRSAQISG